MRMSLFITCLCDAYTPRAGVAVVKVLEHLGCTVDFPQSQTCCGQPMFNNGYEHDARALAARMIRAFADSEYVVTPSGSCAAMIREHYPHLFHGDPALAGKARALAARTFEFSEFLIRILKPDLRALGARWPGRVTWHFSCHLRALGISDEPARLLRQVEGLELVPLDKAEQCCGFGGTFAIAYPQVSGAMARDKGACIRGTGAPTVVSGEPGCTMNLAGTCRREGIPADFKSFAEIIAESLGLLERTDAPAEVAR